MGNETSAAQQQYTKEEVEFYRNKHKQMEDTISINNITILSLMEDKTKYENTIGELKNEITKRYEFQHMFDSQKKQMEDTIRSLTSEKAHNAKMVEELKNEISKRDQDYNYRIKNIDSELDKYKSMPEFISILNLKKQLDDFQNIINSAIEVDCNMLQTNKHDKEIEEMKQRNADLYKQLTNDNIRAEILKKSDELKDAEEELKDKKKIIRQEFLKPKGKLLDIKDEMAQATRKFTETIENSISELQKNLQMCQKKVATIKEDNLQINDLLVYEKVKNILLQQEIILMKDKIKPNLGSSGHFQQYFFNNLKPEKDVYKNNQSNDSSNLVNFIDDDANKTNLVSGKQKTYKLILLNIYECGDKTDEEKVRRVLRELTNMNLDNIDVCRLGIQGNERPIMVAFDSFAYIKELLAKQYLLQNTRFSAVRIMPYKHDTNPNNPKKPGNFPKKTEF